MDMKTGERDVSTTEHNSEGQMTDFTCVVCPWGCTLVVDGENISGYSCARGLKYAKAEQTDPRRAISGSVRILNAVQNVVPVKTSAPLPKHLLREAAALLYQIKIEAPVKTGDVVVPNILGTDSHFIVARSMEVPGEER